MNQRLSESFYQRATTIVAQDLLGKVLVRADDHGRTSGIIVEVEAYLAEDDPASHSFRGMGKKNASMFRPAGALYVYPIHAKYCLNVVTEDAQRGAAVLIRALQPMEGVDLMKVRRGTERIENLTTGPAKLCQALNVDRLLDGENLITSHNVWLEEAPNTVSVRKWTRGVSRRIGISQAQDRLLRWFMDGNRFVSGCARDHSCRRDWSF